jgi:hypothetical protein
VRASGATTDQSIPDSSLCPSHRGNVRLGFSFVGLTCRRNRPVYTSLTFFSGSCRTGLPVAAWMALSTAGATTQMVGSPTPPQKS